MHGEKTQAFCGNLESRYVTPALDENLSMTRGQDTYYMADGLGSIRNLLDADETVLNTYDYYAFGIMITEIEGVECPYRFTAREREPGGLSHAHFYRNRYYMPWTGIFMSRDAMWADVHRGWRYPANNTVNLLDPYGLYNPFGPPFETSGQPFELSEGPFGLSETEQAAVKGFFKGMGISALGICSATAGIFDSVNKVLGIDDTRQLTRDFNKSVDGLFGKGITDSAEYRIGEIGGYAAWLFGSAAVATDVAGLGGMSLGELRHWWNAERKAYFRGPHSGYVPGLNRGERYLHINIETRNHNYHIPLNPYRWGELWGWW